MNTQNRIAKVLWGGMAGLVAALPHPVQGGTADAVPGPPAAAGVPYFLCEFQDGGRAFSAQDLRHDFPETVRGCQALSSTWTAPVRRREEPEVDVLDVLEARASARASALRPLPAEVDALVRASGQRHGVDPQLVAAVVHVESRGQARARSPKGALGLMQVMPATGQRYGVQWASQLLDPATNVDAGVRYLRDLLQMFGGETHLALAAYNAGEGAVLRHGRRIPPYPETQAYVQQVLARHRLLSEPPVRPSAVRSPRSR